MGFKSLVASALGHTCGHPEAQLAKQDEEGFVFAQIRRVYGPQGLMAAAMHLALRGCG